MCKCLVSALEHYSQLAEPSQPTHPSQPSQPNTHQLPPPNQTPSLNINTGKKIIIYRHMNGEVLEVASDTKEFVGGPSQSLLAAMHGKSFWKCVEDGDFVMMGEREPGTPTTKPNAPIDNAQRGGRSDSGKKADANKIVIYRHMSGEVLEVASGTNQFVGGPSQSLQAAMQGKPFWKCVEDGDFILTGEREGRTPSTMDSTPIAGHQSHPNSHPNGGSRSSVERHMHEVGRLQQEDRRLRADYEGEVERLRSAELRHREEHEERVRRQRRNEGLRQEESERALRDNLGGPGGDFIREWRDRDGGSSLASQFSVHTIRLLRRDDDFKFKIAVLFS